ncbi:glycosyltransferase family 25 protein [Aurantimonas sp. A2-1-M11]|uniref:glycosyltransferase family 25 protein n=1 Tax=Aurantimonas sp. A2-1-M11 TaxID=3113712 RepID=UPI002F950573
MASRAPDVVYINLDRAVDRRALMERQGALRGVALTRFPARDAESIDEATVHDLSHRWERPITGPELALFLSHRTLWERAAASRDGIVILEDDAVLSPRFAAVIANLPTGFDLINLECYGRRKFMTRHSVRTDAPARFTAVARDKSGTAAYYCSPAGGRKLADLACKLAAPSDAFIFAVADLRTAQVEPAVAVQVHVLAGRGIDAGIRTTTSIHQPRKRLGLALRHWPFHARRLRTQLNLLPLHVRRLNDVAFRAPELDEDEFRAILPIRFD